MLYKITKKASEKHKDKVRKMAMRFASGFLLFLFMSSSSIAVAFHIPVVNVTAMPAVFLFGDSTFDVGTNNFLNVNQTIKANFLYNGIDFPYSTPTGRFSNGYNTADQIVRLLGYKRSPPSFLSLLNHSSTFKDRILQGVNFASGGSGLLDKTGNKFNNSMSLRKQIEQFLTVYANITTIMGPEETANMVSKSLFLISVGSNDVFDFLDNSTTSPGNLLDNMLSTYHDNLKSLYDIGARKFGIISIPPIGCCPAVRLYNNTGGCFEEGNEFAKKFYNATEELLYGMKSELPGMTYSLGNSYEMTMAVIENAYAFGITDTATACCGDGKTQCNQKTIPCNNRNEYLFWDRFHPTQRTSELAALTLYAGSTRFVTPFNFSMLASNDV
ncbi:hypothetical protein Pint_28617 [Pistacia integerrima]|uniref:Uncharacterized protein n=1 Tax=Pistacia integerrima TaxID=434235 RepID=A0ACC0YSI9_9ROSI|nr:hypothetical protein Pint_28617 [Pistacia integerrima]